MRQKVNSRKKKVYILYISLLACLHCDRWGDPRHHPQHSWIFSCGDGSSSAPEPPQSAITPITHQPAPGHHNATSSFIQPGQGGGVGVDRFSPFSNTARRMEGTTEQQMQIQPRQRKWAAATTWCVLQKKNMATRFSDEKLSQCSTDKKNFNLVILLLCHHNALCFNLKSYYCP